MSTAYPYAYFPRKMSKSNKIVLFAITVLSLFAGISHSYASGISEPSNRKEKWEFAIGAQYTVAQSINFNSGANANVDGTIGWILEVGYNFNEYLALGFEAGWDWNRTNFTGTRIDDNGTPIPVDGELSTSSAMVNLTYNILAKRLTPFVSGHFGWVQTDVIISTAPPSTSCWWDPYLGYVCNNSLQSKSNVTYGGLVGLRYDTSDVIYFKGSAGKQWIDWSDAEKTDNTTVRLSVGFLFN